MGLLDRRLAKHAHDVNVTLPLVRVLEERVDGIPPADLPIDNTLPGDVIEEGKELTRILLAGRSMDLPSPGELRQWQRKARVCIQVVKEFWPEEVVAYVQALESKRDRRLIQGHVISVAMFRDSLDVSIARYTSPARRIMGTLGSCPLKLSCSVAGSVRARRRR